MDPLLVQVTCATTGGFAYEPGAAAASIAAP
jgi:hypothetical protein